MMQGKARAANDSTEVTIGQAETLHAIGMKIRKEAGGNEFAIWAYLLSLPRRQQDQLSQIWHVSTMGEVAAAIALPEVPHG